MNAMPAFRFEPLWSDLLFYLLLALFVAGAVHALRHAHLRRAWAHVFASRAATAAATVMLAYLGVALLDSIHVRPALPPAAGQTAAPQYSVELVSMLDLLLGELRENREKTYSAPFALQLFEKQVVVGADGVRTRDYPRLAHAGTGLTNASERAADIALRAAAGIGLAVVLWLSLVIVLTLALSRRYKVCLGRAGRALLKGETAIAWHAGLYTLGTLLLVFVPLLLLAPHYHVFGTDQVGNDQFYQTLKAMRTALLIGSLSTLVVLPLGIGLGLAAGYFGGWVDDLIQYIYTVVSSIPYVLLIAAAVLMMQVVIESHPDVFDTAATRADARLVSLTAIIGAISWTSLCRLIRAEALKLREQDYVQAARAFGVSHLRIMLRHILPNAFHIVLITTVLEFSTLVLAEAVLSYVGVGVDPTTISFGTMINGARSELAREPVVWWSITAAFSFMVLLVLAANLLADAVRDAFDPRGTPARLRRNSLAGEVQA